MEGRKPKAPESEGVPAGPETKGTAERGRAGTRAKRAEEKVPETAAGVPEAREGAQPEGVDHPAGYSLTFREAALELLGPDAVRAVIAGLIGKASGGDVRAYETLRELTGEALPDMEELQVRMEVVE